MATKVTLVKLPDTSKHLCNHVDCHQQATFLAKLNSQNGWFVCDNHAQNCRDKGLVHNEERVEVNSTV